MKTKTVLATSLAAAFAVSMIFSGALAAQATGNGAPNGADYNLNLNGVKKKDQPPNDSNSEHRKFVKIYGTSKMFVFIVRNGFPDEPSLVSLYQKHARPSDIVAQFTVNLLDSTVTNALTCQKATTYFSYLDIQNNIATLQSNGYQWVVYDLEPLYSPANEVDDPVGSVQQAAQIAHNSGLKLMLTTAGIPLSFYDDMSAYTDGFVLQIRNIGNDAVYIDEVTQAVNLIRTGNPQNKIILQLSVAVDTVSLNNHSYDLVKDQVDGIVVFYYNDVSQIPPMAEIYTHVNGIV